MRPIPKNFVMVTIAEATQPKLDPEDYDRGWIDIPLEYVRGERRSEWPATIRLTRPGMRRVGQLMEDMQNRGCDPYCALEACVPAEYLDRAFDTWLDSLTLFCANWLNDVACEFCLGIAVYHELCRKVAERNLELARQAKADRERKG